VIETSQVRLKTNAYDPYTWEKFVKCTDAYEFGAELYVVLEHMPISLVQVVAAPVHTKETHVAAIVGQVRFQPISPNRRH